MNRPVLQFVGEISYGVYLIPMPIFDLESHVVGRLFPGLSALRGRLSLMVVLFAVAGAFTVGGRLSVAMVL